MVRLSYSALSLGGQWIHVGFSLRVVWKNFTFSLRPGGLLGETSGFSVFSAELGSTVDTCRLQSTRRLEECHTFCILFVPQRQIPMVLLFADHRDFQLQYVIVWSMLLLCMSCMTCPLLCHTGALVQHRRKQWRFRCCSSSTRIRTCPSWCNDRRWSRRADNCGVAAVAVQRGAREIPRCSSRTRLCSCAQPVETPQAQFFSFWALYTGTGPGAPVS